jgi:hypothetical protein
MPITTYPVRPEVHITQVHELLTGRIKKLYRRMPPKPHIFLGGGRWWAVGLGQCNRWHKHHAGAFVQRLNEK